MITSLVNGAASVPHTSTSTQNNSVAASSGIDALATQLAAWKEIQSTDVPALNQELKKSSLPAVGVASSSR